MVEALFVSEGTAYAFRDVDVVRDLEEARRRVRGGQTAVVIAPFHSIQLVEGVGVPREGWPHVEFLFGAPIRVDSVAHGTAYAREVRFEGRETYVRRVDAARDALARGELFQLVVARYRAFRVVGDPLAVFAALARAADARYYYYLRVDDRTLMGASPEILLRGCNGLLVSGPIGGTRPRGRTPEEDSELEGELVNSVKERAEHTMLVDSVRNDLGRICRYGTVRVASMLQVEKYRYVQHLVSYIEGELDRRADALDALLAINPTTTVTGVPKVRAVEYISRLEEEPRGPFTGSVGLIGKDCVDIAVVIRSIYMEGDTAYVWAGAGIVMDSVPEQEYLETEVKMRPMVAALNSPAPQGTLGLGNMNSAFEH